MPATHGFGSRFGWLSDAFHVALGVVAVMSSLISPVITAVIVACYVAYQVADMLMGESPEETLSDIAEFMLGMLIGFMLVKHI